MPATSQYATSALLLAVLVGCANNNPPQGPRPHSAALEDIKPQSTPTTQPARDETLAQAARRSAEDLTALLTGDRPLRQPTGTPEPQGAQRPWQDSSDSAPAPAPQRNQPQTTDSDDSVSQTPDATQANAQPPTQPPADPLPALLAQLEAQSQTPGHALSATLLAQALRAYAGTRDGSRPGQQLSPPEQQLVTTLAPLIEALAAGDRADAPSRIAQAMEQAAFDLAAVLPIRIHHAALATDIHGFASYRPFDTNRFLAGRVNRMLVYTEPAQFQTRPAAEPQSAGDAAAHPGAQEVVLGLELRLFNEAGSMLAWRRPEERVVIRSDRPRREIYLGTLVELPATLTVGRYQLKIILKDHADGSMDERVIPIEIVADPRLTTNPTRRP